MHPPPPEECHHILTQPSIHQDFKGLVGAGCDSGECLDDQVQVQQLSILNGSQPLHSLEQSLCFVGHHCVDEPELDDCTADAFHDVCNPVVPLQGVQEQISGTSIPTLSHDLRHVLTDVDKGLQSEVRIT